LVKTDDAEIHNAIQGIKDFYGRCGFTEFRNWDAMLLTKLG